jgi:hypothetical protein
VYTYSSENLTADTSPANVVRTYHLFPLPDNHVIPYIAKNYTLRRGSPARLRLPRTRFAGEKHVVLLFDFTGGYTAAR